MEGITIEILASLLEEIQHADERTQKLFFKQKQFMQMNPMHPSLGRKKLQSVQDKYGREIWEIRLDRKRRVAFVQKENNTIVWLKICSHDEIDRNKTIFVKDHYQ